MKPLRPRTILLSMIAILASGTVFFRYVEGWGWIDAYFFTVVTVSTVGYGNIVPATNLGKIGATLFIFFGLGVFALFIHQFTYFNMLRRERQAEWLVAVLNQLNRRRAEPESASEDDVPPPEKTPDDTG